MRNIICFVVFLLYSWQTSAEVLVDENVSGGSGQNIRHFQVVEYDSAIPQATIFYTDGYGNLKFLVAELHGYNSGWNFENGLTGWSVTGDAFNYQPTKGDNPTARNRGQPSRHKGDYWIGTYEKYNDNTGSPGSVQGDRPIGEVITKPFVLEKPVMRFLIGGGCDINHVGIAVLLANQKIANATGNCHESMQEKQFDLGAYIGQKLRVKIYDNASGGWGHINVDDIRFEDY